MVHGCEKWALARQMKLLFKNMEAENIKKDVWPNER
jgi:hypothetical protein